MLDDQDVVGVLLLDQELGVVALGVHRIRGDHALGQVQAGQQGPEPGDLVGLAIHIDLAEHGAGLLVQDCHQVHGLPAGAGVPGPPHRLAVHCQRCALPGASLPPRPGRVHPGRQPSPGCLVEEARID